MKVAFISDTHIGCRGDSRNFGKYFARFYGEVFFPYLRENNITRVIHLGDMFDRRKYVNFQSLSDARQYLFEPLREFETDMIVGNHDISYKGSTELNAPDLLLRDYPNLKVHWECTEIEIDGLKLAMLPWVCSDNYLDSIEFINRTKAEILIGHLEMKGFEMHAGELCDSGFDRSVFSRFDRVFTGHFHQPSEQGNITYVGSPYEMTWSDYNQPRGFHVFDTATRELTYIQNPLRMFHKIYYDDTDRDRFEEYIDRLDYSQFENTFVRVVIKNRADQFLFDRLVEKIEQAQPIDITFVDNTIDMMFEEDLDDEIDIEDTMSIISTVIDQIPKETVRSPLKSLMSELHRTAISESSML